MLDLTQIVIIISLVVLTVVLTAVGIQMFLLLKDLRGSVNRLNTVFDRSEDILTKLSHPAASLAGLLSGLREGANIIESVIGLFRKNQQSYPYQQPDEY